MKKIQFVDVDPYQFIGEIWVPIRSPRDYDSDLTKIIASVKSCNHPAHLDCVERMISNFDKIHNTPELTTKLTEYLNLKRKDVEVE
jgi:hypothetical protein